MYGASIDFGTTLRAQLKSLAADRHSRENALAFVGALPNSGELADALKRAGFIRELKPFQLENLAAIRNLPMVQTSPSLERERLP